MLAAVNTDPHFLTNVERRYIVKVGSTVSTYKLSTLSTMMSSDQWKAKSRMAFHAVFTKIIRNPGDRLSKIYRSLVSSSFWCLSLVENTRIETFLKLGSSWFETWLFLIAIEKPDLRFWFISITFSKIVKFLILKRLTLFHEIDVTLSMRIRAF